MKTKEIEAKLKELERVVELHTTHLTKDFTSIENLKNRVSALELERQLPKVSKPWYKFW